MEASQVQEFWQKVALQHPEMADFLCPLGGQLMEDPVTALDGFNYERGAIRLWLETHEVSPQTAQPMAADLRPNEKLRTAIKKFLSLCGANSPTSPVDLLWDAHGLRAEYKT
ncbi:PUB34, partial [Symbiodinium sp. KB8]